MEIRVTKEEIKLFTSRDPVVRKAFQESLHPPRTQYGLSQKPNPRAARMRPPHWSDGRTLESRYVAAEEARSKALYGQ